MTPTERKVYAGMTIGAVLLLLAALLWGFNGLVARQVDKRMRQANPIYTLECRPKGNS